MSSLFIVERTGTCRLVLRRFRHREGEGHLHDASVVIDENAIASPPTDASTKRVGRGDISRTDPRWPVQCGCGERFEDDDEWQVNELDWYEGHGHRFAYGVGAWDGPPGAMIRTRWRDVEGRPEAWMIFLPNGTAWNTNDRASRDDGSLGPYWTVTGQPPLITVSPSIKDRGSRPWHGHIRNGAFT